MLLNVTESVTEKSQEQLCLFDSFAKTSNRADPGGGGWGGTEEKNRKVTVGRCVLFFSLTGLQNVVALPHSGKLISHIS